MGIFAGFLQSLFVGIFTLITTYFGKKIAFGTAIAATFLVVTVGFYTLIKSLVVGVAVTVTNATFLMIFFSILPSNFATCITACLSVDIAVFIYRHQMTTLRAIASAQ